ncbi:hypothetical protein [endosymbiont GvMRE of Glomus versiforme]|nr:hypothetical protein [endosymbiont GvMRE of Glomus versiforme]RHZ37502.1 hypothetical protein GvMRE_I1g419 [endosymbiont GvMRE of Glomus versiforme]
MLKLDIEYKDGSTRHITNDLNKEQFKALGEHLESGRLSHAKRIIIEQK